MAGITASDMLAHEARALLARLSRIKPFVITETIATPRPRHSIRECSPDTRTPLKG